MQIPIEPMEPILNTEPFDDPDFLYQVKWDGIRCISHWKGEELQNLWGKKGQVMTSHYPFLKIVSSLKKGTLLLDGELVLVTPEGKPSFHKLMKVHLNRTKRIPSGYSLVYMVFDLLMVNNQWLTMKPLMDRQKQLEEILHPSPMAQIVPSFSDGKLLYQVTGEHQLEGIVAKRKNSVYSKGKSHRDWFKIKHNLRLNCVLGGILWKDEKKQDIRSLLVGAYVQNKLYYIGSVASGLTGKDRIQLEEAIHGIARNHSPFEGNVTQLNGPVTWIQPLLTMEVEFMEWSPEHKMRSPRLIGFLTIPSRQCILAEDSL